MKEEYKNVRGMQEEWRNQNERGMKEYTNAGGMKEYHNERGI